MRSRVRFISGLVALGLAVTTTVPAAAQQKGAAGGDVAVTVTYSGKGTVDAAHEILVFLFADPNLSENSQPIGMRVATKNGATVTFTNVTTSPVYVVAVYDETGAYHGGGPPPAGLPIAQYAKDAKSPPLAVTPGGKAPIKMTFSDARRWGK